MARKISLLAVVLVALVSLSLILVACGGSEAPATTAGTTTKAPTTTIPGVTTTPDTTPKAPISSVAPGTETTKAPTTSTKTPETTSAPDTFLGPNEEWIETVLFEEGQWVQPHMEYRLAPGKGIDGVNYDYMWYFTIKSEGGHFIPVPEDHPTHPGANGIQMTKGVALYIKDANDETADYEKYDITYWTTQQWYEIYCVADDFVPVDGTEYDIYLVFQTYEDLELEDGTVISQGSNYPGAYHYIWNLGTPWTYKAPEKSESKYLSKAQLDQIVGDGWWLLEHEPTTIDAEGNIQVKFKSDGNPFKQGTDTPGVHFTLFESLYINGEELEIVDGSYVPEEWYILNLKVKDWVPTAGETYEIIITITANDPTDTYCEYDNYYVLAKEVTFAG